MRFWDLELFLQCKDTHLFGLFTTLHSQPLLVSSSVSQLLHWSWGQPVAVVIHILCGSWTSKNVLLLCLSCLCEVITALVAGLCPAGMLHAQEAVYSYRAS